MINRAKSTLPPEARGTSAQHAWCTMTCERRGCRLHPPLSLILWTQADALQTHASSDCRPEQAVGPQEAVAVHSGNERSTAGSKAWQQLWRGGRA